MNMIKHVVHSILVIVFLGTGSFSLASHDNFEIKYKIKGVYHNLNDGITKAEFNKLSLTTNHDLTVKEFRITLARGNRAVKTMDIGGDDFDLKKLTSVARAGDYIVIEIKKLSGERSSCNALFKAIKVI